MGGVVVPSFDPHITWAANSSNTTGALSFNAFAFFTANAAAPTTALSVGTDRIAFAKDSSMC
jgi:hypothetical protein